MPEYPGLGLDLRHVTLRSYDGPEYPMGISRRCYGSESDMLLVREVAMMIVMDRLTDKPDWHQKVYDEEIASKWTDEAMALPADPLYKQIAAEDPLDLYQRGVRLSNTTILDRGCMEYCINELRDKAKFFEETALIPTLDASATAVKSDVLIPQSLRDALRSAFNQLMEDSKENPDFHPDTNDMVHDLVHPSLYPLVYGRTRVFRDEVVGVADAVEKWSGKGSIIPVTEGPRHMGRYWERSSIKPTFWSDVYQWLPANVEFVEGGGVRFRSYINNLHPVKYRGIYDTIEKLIETVLPAWDFCLGEQKADQSWRGRHESRFPMVESPFGENNDNWEPPEPPKNITRKRAREAKEATSWIHGYLSDYSDENLETRYWIRTRQAAHPPTPEYEPVNYNVPRRATLRSLFEKQGLQVIVKMATVELTPEKPSFPAGGWHVEGQMNEHIVGTAIYYLDSENITPSRLAFRMPTLPDQYYYGQLFTQDDQWWLSAVFGAAVGGGNSGSPCIQNYGSVETKEGRLLAFPNVFQHRVSGFELADKTKPGHRRIMVLWLVDPQTRIISTANVPPQQRDWWFESAFGNAGPEVSMPLELAQIISESARGEKLPDVLKPSGEIRLPPEIIGMVREEMAEGQLPMGLEEAREHQRKLMRERSGLQWTAERDWNDDRYSFCEH